MGELSRLLSIKVPADRSIPASIVIGLAEPLWMQGKQNLAAQTRDTIVGFSATGPLNVRLESLWAASSHATGVQECHGDGWVVFTPGSRYALGLWARNHAGVDLLLSDESAALLKGPSWGSDAETIQAAFAELRRPTLPRGLRQKLRALVKGK